MSHLQPHQLSQPVRQYILRAIVDIESRIYGKDIALIDLAPRNIILVGPAEQEPQMVFVDFCDAFFHCDEDDSTVDVIKRFLGRYIFPILRWKEQPAGFNEWIDWSYAVYVESEFSDTGYTVMPEMRGW